MCPKSEDVWLQAAELNVSVTSLFGSGLVADAVGLMVFRVGARECQTDIGQRGS